MSTAGAFLGDVEVFIKVDGAIWTGGKTVLTSCTFGWVDYNQTVVPLINTAAYRAG
jgi:hypothetical protein